MSEATEIHSAHPLFRELRNGLLWHCTSPKEFLQMRAEGFIKPNPSPIGKYGMLRSACQCLDGISLFDFTTASEEHVLGAADKWQPFLGCARPLTIVIGLGRPQMPGRLVVYPENRDTTPPECGGPIPWVEVCHVGLIPVSAIVSHLLVCAVDYGRFKPHEKLDDSTLSRAEAEFASAVQLESEERNKLFAEVRATTESPEQKARMEQVRRMLNKFGGKND